MAISQVADRLGIRPREDITGAAHRLYKLAVQRQLHARPPDATGRRRVLVHRVSAESRPYMLIDFSDVVQTNVYVLGAVFLQLCRLLRLEQHPLISKPIDPSLFIHRFADKLNLNRRMLAVANTALRLVASMKRDWMQTGRSAFGRVRRRAVGRRAAARLRALQARRRRGGARGRGAAAQARLRV